MAGNYTPGPSQVYFTVADHARQAFKNNIPSLSHRSKAFEKIVAFTNEQLRELLKLPADYAIFFTSSATEIWERCAENLVSKKAIHYVNGSFSTRFAEISEQVKKNVVRVQTEEGMGFSLPPIVDTETDFVAVTHNETSTGVSWDLAEMHQIKNYFPNAIIAVDAVSSLPYPAFDYNKIDSAFFSVQKAFGLPPGLGVWLVNQACLQKAETLQKNGNMIGTYHSIPSLYSFYKKNQTPETPNTLGIYLLGKVAEDFNRRGIHILRKETEYKAALLYNALENHTLLHPFVKENKHRSKTVIVANTEAHTQALTNFLVERGIQPGDGYGKNKATQLRFANFPAHSKEQVEFLVDTLAEFAEKK
ncbi:MAG: aminotransferase class V-fold PLP-dependent enzyme [Cyclobacteriaceae bacterium]|jgi:phosphoserine aminotransferase|nr:aminotransferase class V-fold PLP-dependent enzyme [Cyclobacteriaceae bacterium]